MRNIPCNPQVRFNINVWCGRIGSKIIGPVFYGGTLMGERYLEFLATILEEFFG